MSPRPKRPTPEQALLGPPFGPAVTRAAAARRALALADVTAKPPRRRGAPATEAERSGTKPAPGALREASGTHWPETLRPKGRKRRARRDATAAGPVRPRPASARALPRCRRRPGAIAQQGGQLKQTPPAIRSGWSPRRRRATPSPSGWPEGSMRFGAPPDQSRLESSSHQHFQTIRRSPCVFS